MKLTKAQAVFLGALAQHGRLSASTANPPVLGLAWRGLLRFVRRAEDLSVMEITPAGRAALSTEQTVILGGGDDTS